MESHGCVTRAKSTMSWSNLLLMRVFSRTRSFKGTASPQDKDTTPYEILQNLRLVGMEESLPFSRTRQSSQLHGFAETPTIGEYRFNKFRIWSRIGAPGSREKSYSNGPYVPRVWAESHEAETIFRSRGSQRITAPIRTECSGVGSRKTLQSDFLRWSLHLLRRQQSELYDCTSRRRQKWYSFRPTLAGLLDKKDL